MVLSQGESLSNQKRWKALRLNKIYNELGYDLQDTTKLFNL